LTVAAVFAALLLPLPHLPGADPTLPASPLGTPAAPPPGYKSNAEVMAAIGLKLVKLIEPVKELPVGVVETTDLEYGRVGERSLKLDLYQPADLKQSVPGLIFIHGGAWSGGSRDVYKYRAMHIIPPWTLRGAPQ
jgi:acetyl esterase/lipase